jgi:hypothetical protein
MPKILIGLLALVLAAAMGAAWALVQVPDNQMESIGSQCVPVYYSGLECCKN